MTAWRAEWLRWWREPGQRWVLALLAMVWLLAAVAGGWGARQQRVEQAVEAVRWQQQVAEHFATADRRPLTPPQAAAQAFDLGRHLGPRIALSGEPGLALALHGSAGRDTWQGIGLESRHLDARRTEPLRNPLFAEGARLDLAVLIALLLPLGWIAMCHGLVLEDRQHGRWRWLCAQMPRPAALVARALLLRAGTLLVLATLASVLALWLDGAAGWFVVLGPWLLALAGFVLSWTVLTALVLALPVSAGGATLALLGLWAVLTLVLPAGLGSSVEAQIPMPSRLEAVVNGREQLQAAEVRNDELLEDWYQRHSQDRAEAPTQHAWPVSFLPRYLWLDAQLRPLMDRFERARLDQAVLLSRWAAWSPALALVMTADSLAGHDAQRHAEYVAELARREDAWRSSLVSAVMSYAGLRSVDRQALVSIGEPAAPGSTFQLGPLSCWWLALVLLAPAGFLASRFELP